MQIHVLHYVITSCRNRSHSSGQCSLCNCTLEPSIESTLTVLQCTAQELVIPDDLFEAYALGFAHLRVGWLFVPEMCTHLDSFCQEGTGLSA
jgi:hypothetical protein